MKQIQWLALVVLGLIAGISESQLNAWTTYLTFHNLTDIPVIWRTNWPVVHSCGDDEPRPVPPGETSQHWSNCTLSETFFDFPTWKSGAYREPGSATFLAYGRDGNYGIKVKSAWHDITDFIEDLPGKIKDLGEAGVKGIKTGLKYVGEGINIALDKTGVAYLYHKLGISDAVNWFKDQAETVYGKAIKPAFMIVKPGFDIAKEGAQAAAKFTLNVAGSIPDALELVTNDGHCPHAEIECFAGTGENTLSCGKIEANRGFNPLQGGCQIKPGDVQAACRVRCQDMHQTTFKPEDISFVILDKTGFRVADFVNVFKKKSCDPVEVPCFAGFGEAKTKCGTVKIGTSASSAGKGCTVNLNEIKPKCDDLCMDKLGVTSND